MKRLILATTLLMALGLVVLNVTGGSTSQGTVVYPREYPGQEPEWRTCPSGYMYFADVDPDTNLITPSCYDESDTTLVMTSDTVCPYELMPIINNGVLECHELGRTVEATR